jgi:hypothetical protein
MNREKIRGFRPTEEVERMLCRAEKDGIKITHILNNAARSWLQAKGYARKKDVCATCKN